MGRQPDARFAVFVAGDDRDRVAALETKGRRRRLALHYRRLQSGGSGARGVARSERWGFRRLLSADLVDPVLLSIPAGGAGSRGPMGAGSIGGAPNSPDRGVDVDSVIV